MTVQAGGVADVGASSLQGVARSVEYLGSTVQVGIDVAGLETLSAVVSTAPARTGTPPKFTSVLSA
ncbi:TOBE domain-containing protein [Rhizobacter sp. AJA081-3]|uniref:TOBE domain-containing protein n=1 Tax=Rhizobacter sp. AJA081-3 TaxID=2753607 RepID=UPI001ADFDD15|nr:TOBE domain-containing protein [Rhizobacter sp. AJA081-3]